MIDNYKEHYKECIKQSNIIAPIKTDINWVYDVKTVHNFIEQNDEYQNLIKKISNKMKNKFDNNIDCVNIGSKFVTYLNNWNDIPEVFQLGELIKPQIENKVFLCNTKVEFLLPYRNEITDKSITASWLWHYDDCPAESLKLIIYLNDTDERNGCFQYLSIKEEPLSFKSSKISPTKQGRQVIAGSRLPSNLLEKAMQNGGKINSFIGERGSNILFSPNVIHRATVPEKGTSPRYVLNFIIRPSLRKYKKYINESTHSILPKRNVKVYELD